MILEYNGSVPSIASDVFVAPTATIIGNVIIGEGSSVWFGAVLRGDEGRIIIGRNTNIQNNAIIHSTAERPTVICDDVTVGNAAVLKGCTIESGAVVGIGAIVLEYAMVGEQGMVEAGSVVLPGTKIPPLRLAAGAPAVDHKDLDGPALRSVQVSSLINRKLAQQYMELLGARPSSPATPPTEPCLSAKR